MKMNVAKKIEKGERFLSAHPGLELLLPEILDLCTHLKDTNDFFSGLPLAYALGIARGVEAGKREAKKKSLPVGSI